ncbi:S8 family serine peptidase [Phycicoccus sp. Root563]|uniref:S8 family serine peptidase n=1 Tax=Phycicoccus sp. Root563 TaxID=1736562 RepID=UPI000A8A4B3A|nr:S8 family serine peptidase [Phycicoccus sp. Root563]
MRRSRMVAVTGAVALATTALAGTTASAAVRTTHTTAVSSAGADTSYVVLADRAADADGLAADLRRAGGQVTTVNRAIGLVTVRSSSSGFLARARHVAGVAGAARDSVVGRAPDAGAVKDRVLKEHQSSSGGSTSRDAHSEKGKKGKGKADPLDSLLWGMDMINAPAAHRTELGDKRVKVGIMDTGVDATHPDLAANFDRRLSRNFTTDLPEIDGPCEHVGCVDPATEDDDGHGTHVAGTIAAALNGMGVSGVAPDVDIVNVRAGQDSGFFFLGATANALTYSGDVGIDVVNMSFYVDPWLYNCRGGAPEDTPEQAAEQDMIIATMNRALEYAHHKGVTLVAALGNEHDNVSNPRTDTTSPDFPLGTEHPRTIDNANCVNLPLEGPHVIGVSALGPSQRKADYSNYANDLGSGELEVSAPGGWFRDGLGTDTFRTNGNLILSTAPLNVMVEEGQVDANGDITPLGASLGTMKSCTTHPARGATACGYYQYLQGTSMASPHAAGVAALAVSAHGRSTGHGGFGLAPDRVRRLLMRTATDHACPTPALQTYTDVGRSAEFDALCVGGTDVNSFYGDGIVNAAAVVRKHD